METVDLQGNIKSSMSEDVGNKTELSGDYATLAIRTDITHYSGIEPTKTVDQRCSDVQTEELYENVFALPKTQNVNTVKDKHNKKKESKTDKQRVEKITFDIRNVKIVMCIQICVSVVSVVISTVATLVIVEPGLTDGSWSVWGSWSNCSASCDGGHRSRSRNCTMARLSPFADCRGSNVQKEICNSKACKEEIFAFYAYNASVIGSHSKQRVTFTDILFNYGGAYNSSSGIFTSPTTGIYQFNSHLCAELDVEERNYVLKAEDRTLVSGEYRTPSNATDGKCISFSTTAYVRQDERVWIQATYLFQVDDFSNTFSGVLIHKM